MASRSILSPTGVIVWLCVVMRVLGRAIGPSSRPENLRRACPPYQNYAATLHRPLSDGPLKLPFQRPAFICRTFSSPAVEDVISMMTSHMVDADLARIFENAFPNTLDTTISWHADGSSTGSRMRVAKELQYPMSKPPSWDGLQSFIVTGDINAEWLRDSTNQLQAYQALAPKDPALANLIRGAISTQAEYVIQSPYCNAFQPPAASGQRPAFASEGDRVSPMYDSNVVFECKYELDSLAHFLRLGNEYHSQTQDTSFLTKRWYMALEEVLNVLDEQSYSTFNETTGTYIQNQYHFQRSSLSGSETLKLGGIGHPFNAGTGLIRSAFRPSDDTTILPLFIPANAMMAVELGRTAMILNSVGKTRVASALEARAQSIRAGIEKHGIVDHPIFGQVYAYEVDGYGSHIIMDDANLPSLLSLPFLGYCDRSDPVYQNTRKMILQQSGNPYFLTGEAFAGIGGPHIGLRHAWPMSRLMQAMTSNDDQEIMDSIDAVKNVSHLGLIHESINVELGTDYTRSWFAWANSVFAQTIIDIAVRKPNLIFERGAEPIFIGKKSAAAADKPESTP